MGMREGQALMRDEGVLPPLRHVFRVEALQELADFAHVGEEPTKVEHHAPVTVDVAERGAWLACRIAELEPPAVGLDVVRDPHERKHGEPRLLELLLVVGDLAAPHPARGHGLGLAEPDHPLEGGVVDTGGARRDAHVSRCPRRRDQLVEAVLIARKEREFGLPVP